eukprot:534882-Rhodomonas_salina.5
MRPSAPSSASMLSHAAPHAAPPPRPPPPRTPPPRAAAAARATSRARARGRARARLHTATALSSLATALATARSEGPRAPSHVTSRARFNGCSNSVAGTSRSVRGRALQAAWLCAEQPAGVGWART